MLIGPLWTILIILDFSRLTSHCFFRKQTIWTASLLLTWVACVAKLQWPCLKTQKPWKELVKLWKGKAEHRPNEYLVFICRFTSKDFDTVSDTPSDFSLCGHAFCRFLCCETRKNRTSICATILVIPYVISVRIISFRRQRDTIIFVAGNPLIRSSYKHSIDILSFFKL